MQRIKAMLRGEKGVTLIEMMVVIAIIGILAAVVAGVTAGISTSAKGSKKDSDIKSVEDAVARYETDNASTPITESSDPGTAVSDADGDGTIVVKVTVTGASDPGDFPTTPDATCSGATVAAALDACFGTVDFSLLVPDYVSTDPAHASDVITFALASGADLSITSVDRLGNNMEIYSDTAVTSSDDFYAWNVNGSTAYVMIDSGSY